MPEFKDRIGQFLRTPFSAILLLFGITMFSYGMNVPNLGFYWDSWGMNWIAQTRGAAGLAQYFSTNRPVWGLLYQLTTPLFGATPLAWNILALVLRWLVAVAVWGVLRLVWPERRELALWAALLSVVYPGFQQQSIGFLYSHFYIVLGAFLASLACSLLALKYPRWRWLWLVLGLVLSAINLMMLEYFFVLELLRPIILWMALSEGQAGFKARLRRTASAWTPYLAVFAGAILWRTFFFSFQTTNYQLSVLTQLKTQPVQTITNLVIRFFEQIWIAAGQAWIEAFGFWNHPKDNVNVVVRYGLILAAVFAAITLYGLLRGRSTVFKRSWQPFLLAAAGLGLAGWPFLLTDIPFRLQFAFDRFTLPFIFGACLLFAALLEWMPRRMLAWLVLAGLVGLGAAYQTQLGVRYRQDWMAQRDFFWQLTARIPSLQPGTLIIANEDRGGEGYSTNFSTDNSLTAPINWIYDPTNRSQTLNYLLSYPSIRVGGQIPRLEAGQPVYEDYLVAKFIGNTSQSIALFYDGYACLRVLDPIIDANKTVGNDDLKVAAAFSDLSRIQALPGNQESPAPLPAIFGNRPTGSWCQLYEKADLFRQLGQWYNIIKIWDQAKELAGQSKFDGEYQPFVEAFARSADWDQAASLTPTSPKSRPIFCTLWQQLDQTGPDVPAKSKAVQGMMAALRCNEYGMIPILR